MIFIAKLPFEKKFPYQFSHDSWHRLPLRNRRWLVPFDWEQWFIWQSRQSKGNPRKMTKPYFCGKIRRGLHITANIANKRLWGYKYKSAVFPSPLTNSSLTRKKNRTINYQSFTTWLIWNVYVTHIAVTKPAVVGSPVYLQLLCRKVIMRDYLEVTDTLHRMQI